MGTGAGRRWMRRWMRMAGFAVVTSAFAASGPGPAALAQIPGGSGRPGGEAGDASMRFDDLKQMDRAAQKQLEEAFEKAGATVEELERIADEEQDQFLRRMRKARADVERARKIRDDLAIKLGRGGANQVVPMQVMAAMPTTAQAAAAQAAMPQAAPVAAQAAQVPQPQGVVQASMASVAQPVAPPAYPFPTAFQLASPAGPAPQVIYLVVPTAGGPGSTPTRAGTLQIQVVQPQAEVPSLAPAAPAAPEAAPPAPPVPSHTES